MKVAMLRRRKLGRTSCREIANKSVNAITVVRNDLPGIAEAGFDLLIRWGCTSQMAVKNVLNSVEAIHQVNDKLEFRRLIEEEELGPPTWFNHMDVPQHCFPVVVRPDRHAQGRNLHVCDDALRLHEVCSMYPKYYISKLINKVAEYRVFVVQGRVACVAQKTPGNPDQVAWNVAQGGRFDNVRFDDWPLRAVKAAIEAFNLTTLDFGGVDVMVDADGVPYILEINSAPSLTSEYRQSCMAKCFDYIIANGKKRIEIIKEKGGYLKFIHPAINDRAKLV